MVSDWVLRVQKRTYASFFSCFFFSPGGITAVVVAGAAIESAKQHSGRIETNTCVPGMFVPYTRVFVFVFFFGLR